MDLAEGNDPDANTRTAMNTNGNTGDAVGSVQGDATADANASFGTVSAGGHAHTIDSSGIHSHNMGNIVLRSPNEDGDENGTPRWAAQRFNVFTSPAGTHQHSAQPTGSHTHSITGGDAETRPINASVNWIIKT